LRSRIVCDPPLALFLHSSRPVLGIKVGICGVFNGRPLQSTRTINKLSSYYF
jgi:hypothetical protein